MVTSKRIRPFLSALYIILLGGLIVAIIVATREQHGPVPLLPGAYISADKMQSALDQINAYAGLTFVLAGEHFKADRASGKRRILTTYRGGRVLLYTDGAITLVVLPVQLPDSGAALTNYCHLYNAWVEWDTDQIIKKRYDSQKRSDNTKHLEEARKTYQLLGKYANPDLKWRYAAKIKLIDKMSTNIDIDTVYNEFIRLCDELIVVYHITDIENASSINVTNMYDLRIP